jgi:hypothetical protein
MCSCMADPGEGRDPRSLNNGACDDEFYQVYFDIQYFAFCADCSCSQCRLRAGKELCRFRVVAPVQQLCTAQGITCLK